MDTPLYHKAVLCREAVDGLNIHPEGIYVDVTFGGGGHSAEMLSRLGPKGKLFAFDQDPDARENALNDPRFTLIAQNFRHLKRALRLHGIKKVHGILADFGVSSHQFDAAERGFSFRFDADLDMRMNPDNPVNAATILDTYEEIELRKMFSRYGELPKSGQLARTIVQQRDEKPIKSTGDLLAILEKMYAPKQRNSARAQAFQALRIEVNDEMGALAEFLEQVADQLEPGGRFVSITYHSLEDRMVKHLIRSGNLQDEPERDDFGKRLLPFLAITRKPISPSDDEIEINPRARSAKMRIAEKI
ncbi:MAG: 16S rRNA (cytosine(1402)-N(4))-methyltransferase RsmH [Cryomorphaceae bacterium]|nr:16S rRNA (cytosine(1402)-N(4))-methyltransferase RsmH [Cryomorphaceae bacterium]